ncbi:MAG: AI-2E family transporter [Tissierellia bacterium]|nr:AI-2E family transporter [Tissierellia bacterium]
MNKNTKYLERMIIRLIVIALLIFFFFMNFSSVMQSIVKFLWMLMPFLLGLVISYVVNMPMVLIEEFLFLKVKNKRLRRAFAIILSYIIVLGALTIIILFVMPQVITSVQTMRLKLPAFMKYLSDMLKSHQMTKELGYKIDRHSYTVGYSDVIEFINGFLKTGNIETISSVLKTVSTIFSTTFNTILAFIFSIYALAGKEKLQRHMKKIIYTFLDEKNADKLMHVLSVSNDSFRKFIGGRIIDAFIIGVLCFVITSIFKIPYASVISVAVGFTNIIPIVGPFIGGAFGFVMIVISSPIKSIIFLVIILVLQQLDGNFIFPKIAGRSMGLPAIWTLLAVSLGGSLFGIVGILFFVPLFNIVYRLMGEYTDKTIKEKNLNLEDK